MLPEGLILASASPRRQRLFSLLGVPFTSLTADVEENRGHGEKPEEMVCRLSRAKAEAIATTILKGSSLPPTPSLFWTARCWVNRPMPMGQPACYEGCEAESTWSSVDLIIPSPPIEVKLWVLDGSNGRVQVLQR